MPKPILTTSRPQLVSVVFVFIAGLLGCEQAAESDVSLVAHTTFRDRPVEVTLTRFAGTRTLESRVRVQGVRFREVIRHIQGFGTSLWFPGPRRSRRMERIGPDSSAFGDELVSRIDLPSDIEPQIVTLSQGILHYFYSEPDLHDPDAPLPNEVRVDFDLRLLFPEEDE